jgi:multidrug efflux pump subunit AcrA (membrane-fusion protein)
VVTLRATYAGAKFSWQGKIVRTEAEIDAKSRMVHAVARIDNAASQVDGQPPLRVGQFVNADIQGRLAENITVLPRVALRNNDQVLIVDAEDRLQFRYDKLLRVYREKAYVLTGLSPGERVCISPLQTVVEGMLVQPSLDIPRISS